MWEAKRDLWKKSITATARPNVQPFLRSTSTLNSTEIDVQLLDDMDQIKLDIVPRVNFISAVVTTQVQTANLYLRKRNVELRRAVPDVDTGLSPLDAALIMLAMEGSH